jgi:hypothetical protein
MRPKWTHRVRLETPGPKVVNPATGLEESQTTVRYNVPARLSQAPVANVGSQIELLASQNTTISLWTLQVPPSELLTSQTVAYDDDGRAFKVVGEPARRPDQRPDFLVASVRLISDMQA